jgi:hypothetical protein
MKRYWLQLQRVFSSVAVGIGGFVITMFVTILLGEILPDPSEHGHAFFSPQDANLFLLSILLGLLVAIVVSAKCYRYIGNAR